MDDDAQREPATTYPRREPGASWVREADGDRTLEENWLFRLRRERFRSRASGRTHDFFVIHLADAVNVIALTPDRHVVLVEQFRAGSCRDSLETPGGLLEPGEDPLAAGARELLEETGYAGDPPQLLGSAWSNPSILSSRITTILMTNARKAAEPKLDAGEEVRVVLVPAARIPAYLRDGKIDHALAVQGLLHWLVAEIPDTPLAAESVGLSRPYQFKIATIMAAVVVVALLSAMAKTLGTRSLVALAASLVFPAAIANTFLWLDPPQKAVLLRPWATSPRRGILRFMATIGVFAMGLLGVLWFVLP